MQELRWVAAGDGARPGEVETLMLAKKRGWPQPTAAGDVITAAEVNAAWRWLSDTYPDEFQIVG